MLFDLDIPKIIERSLLVHLRKSRVMAFTRALCAPVKTVHDEMMVLRADTIAQYQYNGLKHSLEALLNDHYDPVDRRIYITVPGRYEQLWYQEDGEQPLAYYEEDDAVSGFIWMSETEIISAQWYAYEFMINVPSLISFLPEAMFDLVDIYRYAGKRPAIRTFDGLNFTIDIYLYPNG
ncbi:MAG: hypothetical protein JNL05_10615 [Flavobacteriales bacterium]|nr:hypothetical protein [Flavobacteriales bacterium]